MSKANWRRLGWFVIILFSTATLVLSLCGINWKTFGNTIISIEPSYAALALLIGTLPMFIRAARWQILLQAEAPVPYWLSFWAVSAGYFGNNFLPARGGELLRSYLIRSRSKLTIGYILATAISERVADAVALVLIGAAVMLLIPPQSSWLDTARMPFAFVGIAGALFLACLPLLQEPVQTLLKHSPALAQGMTQVMLGIRSFHHLQRLAHFSALTLVIWTLDAVATVTLAHSMAIPISMSIALLLIVALSLSSAIPSTPGYVGIYQLVAVTVLKPFGISASTALAFILVTQVMNYLQTSVLGLIAINKYAVSWPAFLRPQSPIQTQS